MKVLEMIKFMELLVKMMSSNVWLTTKLIIIWLKLWLEVPMVKMVEEELKVKPEK